MPTMEKKSKCQRPPMATTTIGPTGVGHLSLRLEALQNWLNHNSNLLNLTPQQISSILFIVRVCDSLHAQGNATFITDSWIVQLQRSLDIPYVLQAELELGAIRWSYASYYAYHVVTGGGVDGDALQELSKIAKAAVEGSLDVTKGHEWLNQVDNHDDKDSRSLLQRLLRSPAGLYLIYPIGAASFGVVFFGATMIDAGFAAIAGFITAMILHATDYIPAISGVTELLISIVVSMVASTAYRFFPNGSCFTEQTLGSLAIFLYGLAYITSLYEITVSSNGTLLMTGVTRFAAAVFKTFILAVGVVIGSWLAIFAGEGRVEHFLQQDCSRLDTQPTILGRLLMAPLVFLAVLMSLQISPQYWIVCMIPQLCAFGSQFVLDILLQQPILVVNVMPAFVATIACYASIALAQQLSLTDLKVSASAYLNKSSRQRPQFSRQVGQRNFHVSRLSLGVDIVPEDDTKKSQHSQRSDLWFCLMPCLLLLVPGASVWRIAFFSVLEATWNNDYGTSASSVGELISGVLVIGIAQVIGVRLGFTTLSLYASIKQFLYSPPEGQLDNGNKSRELVGRRNDINSVDPEQSV